MVAIVLIYAVRRRMRLASMRQAGAAVATSSPDDDLEMSNVTQSYEDDSPSSTQRRSSRPETISAEE